MANQNNAHTIEELKRLQSLPLDDKIHITEARILEFWHKMNGKVYVSFSGGKDSTVLLHIVRNILPDVEAVFSNTGLEFPEIVEFVKSFDNVTIIRPKMTFRQVIEKYGYPLVSKEVSDTIWYGKRNTNSVRFKQKLSGEMKGSRYDQSRWAFLLDAPFELNAHCCKEMKKKPFHEFGKQSGKFPIIGTTASESLLRERGWLLNGCNNFTKGREKSQPMSIWTEKDVWEYVERFKLPLAKPYAMGYLRTGCVFCAFGAHLEKSPNRFQRLKQTHPNLYAYMMKPKEEGGLGFKEPLEYIGIELGESQVQTTIDDFIKKEDE